MVEAEEPWCKLCKAVYIQGVIRSPYCEGTQPWPGTSEVITVDQPLYAIAKKIQWTWPEHYGENHIVIVLGGLHVEMAALKVIKYF